MLLEERTNDCARCVALRDNAPYYAPTLQLTTNNQPPTTNIHTYQYLQSPARRQSSVWSSLADS